MINNSIKDREHLLKNDKNPSFLQKWEIQSKRFGKINIFNIFQSVYSSLDKDDIDTQFKYIFDTMVIEKIKWQKDINFLKRKNYADIMSLFGKFIYIQKNTCNQILDTMLWNPQDTTQQDIVKKDTIQQDIIQHVQWKNWIQLSLFDELPKNIPIVTPYISNKSDSDIKDEGTYSKIEYWWNR